MNDLLKWLGGAVVTAVLGFILKWRLQTSVNTKDATKEWKDIADAYRKDIGATAEMLKVCEGRLAAIQTKIENVLAPTANIVADITERIVEVDGGAVVLLRYSRDQLMGKPVYELVDPRLRERHKAAVQRLMRTGVLRGGVVRGLAVRGDGTTVPVEVSLGRSWKDPVKGWMLHAQLREIPEEMGPGEEEVVADPAEHERGSVNP